MRRLLDILREDFHLTGTKEGCGEGECGACSVFFDGELVNSCLIPAIQLNNANIETIERISQQEAYSSIQHSFLKHGGAQCGICTPGMIMASVNILKKNPHPDENIVREGLSGNLCRCTGYTRIIESVLSAFTDSKRE